MTTLRLFTLSHACSTGLVCRACRATTAEGEAWRAAMGESYDMSGACPRGLPMGWAGEAERDCVPAAPPRPRLRGPRAPRRLGVGDHLHAIIVERYGVEGDDGCGCGSLAAEMNTWGPAGCLERIDTIARALADNVDKLKGWRGWFAGKMPGAAIMPAARAMVREAIDRYTTAAGAADSR